MHPHLRTHSINLLSDTWKMAYVEKCDMVWGSDGNVVLLSSDFERQLKEDGRTSKRISNLTYPSRKKSSFQWRSISRAGSPAQSLDSICEITEISQIPEVEKMDDVDERHVDERQKFINRAGTRLRRIARNTGDIGLKIVALPTFVLLDMIS